MPSWEDQGQYQDQRLWDMSDSLIWRICNNFFVHRLHYVLHQRVLLVRHGIEIMLHTVAHKKWINLYSSWSFSIVKCLMIYNGIPLDILHDQSLICNKCLSLRSNISARINSIFPLNPDWLCQITMSIIILGFFSSNKTVQMILLLYSQR